MSWRDELSGTQKDQWGKGRRLAVVLSAIVACLFNAGLAFGFSAMFPVLVQLDAFHDLCPGSQPSGHPCARQRQALMGMFTLATSALNIAALPTGALLDAVGPSATAALGATVTSLGCLLFAAGGDGAMGHLAYYCGFLLLAVCGPVVFTSTLSFSNFFPRRKGLICAALVGCFDASSAVFLVLAVLIRGGVPFQAAFGGFALVPLATAALAALVWPRAPVPVRLQDIGSRVSRLSVSLVDPPWWKHPKLQHLTMRQQLRSVVFRLLLLTACVMMVCINFFIATVFPQMEEVEPATALHLTQTFALLLPLGGIVYTPVIGHIVDRIGPTVGFVILWLLYVTFQGLLQVYSTTRYPAVAYAAFAIFAMIRPMFYTLVATFTGQTFGFGTFGKVYGGLSSLAGLANTLTQPLGLLAGHSGFRTANGVLLLVQLTTAALPAYVLLRRPAAGAADAAEAGKLPLLPAEDEELEDDEDTVVMARCRSYSVARVSVGGQALS